MSTNSKFFEDRTICPICECTRLEILHTHKFEPISDVSVYDKYDVVRCCQCEFVFANNIPAQSEFDIYYESFSKYETESTEPVVSDMYSFVTECICEISDTEHRVMDIGCGYGNILYELSSRGFNNLTGVDPSKSNIESLNQYGIKGICSSLFNVHTEAVEKQDCIILTGVLEHVVDLIGAVASVTDLVAEGGTVLVGVPDINQFSLDICTPFREFSIEHINYFSKQSLTALFSQFGMVFEKHWLFHGIIVTSFRKPLRAKSGILDYIRQCDEVVNSMIAKIRHFCINKKPVLIWGAGTLTQYLLANTALRDCNIIGIVDSNIHYKGKKLHTIEIIPPISLTDQKYKETPIIISTYAHSQQIEEIIRNELRLTNDIITL